MHPPTPLTIETDPDPADIRVLEERLYEFNVEATGIADGELFGVFLRDADGAVVGGAEGWTWGGTCYLRHLFVPAGLRRRGQGSRLMAEVEAMVRRRGSALILLETYDFQAPDFYRRLGFSEIGSVADSPRGHRKLTFGKRLT